MYKINIFDKLHNKKQHIVFDGPNGLLEGVTYNMNNIKGENLALILPPDPTHKGTMNNKIVNYLFNEFQKLGFSTLKINYRGIGLSKGAINQKEDLIIDALHALDFLIKKCETHKVKNPKIFISGFSLGGWVALQCAMRRPEISGFITINTKFNPNDFNMLTPCPNGLVLQATYDALTNPEYSEKFASQLINQKGCSIKFKTLNDDHYLTNSADLLQEIIPEYIKELKTRQILKK